MTGTKLKEQLVKDTLRSLDWPSLKSHVEKVSLNKDKLQKLCGLIRRCSDLICKYPNKEFQAKRESFFGELHSYVEEALGASVAEQVSAENALIAQIESGYSGILGLLELSEIGKAPAKVRVSAAINRACHEYQIQIEKQESNIEKSEYLNLLSANLELENEDGGKYTLDAVVEGLSCTLAMTLIMEAYKNAWFDGDQVVLPTKLPAVGDSELYKAGSTQVYASFWRNWQRLEKRCRYWGGDIQEVESDNRPENLPDNKSLLSYFPKDTPIGDGEIYDYIANSRVRERLLQTMMEMDLETGLSDQVIGIDPGAGLPPADFVSAAEAHACISLCEIMGYSIVDDPREFGGLRFIEWIRGYAVLQEIAKSLLSNKKPTAADYAITLDQTDLVSTLQRCGLSLGAASTFVARVCLRQNSQDLFDTPLVRVGASAYLLFAPSVIAPNIAVVVTSSLSSVGEPLGHKGNAFEKTVNDRFRGLGFDCFAFKFQRDGEEFEYDAVVLWNDHLFVFECKNRSLSGNDPIQAYYFDKQVSAHAKQVTRLVDALRQFPEIAEQKLGVEIQGLTIVPCVMHSLTYSRKGKTDGVYFTDSSALFRFFESRYITINSASKPDKSVQIQKVPITSIWSGDKPTVADFIKHLENPHQVDLQIAHLKMEHTYMQLSESVVAHMAEISISEKTPESICKAFGVDEKAVLKKLGIGD